MEALSFEEARRVVTERVSSAQVTLPLEEILLGEVWGRTSGEALRADRDYPPVARSIRDGFAVQAVDLPGVFEVVGEIRAGQPATGRVGSREAIEIMTGGALPDGADTVVMVEHAIRNGTQIRTERRQKAGEFVNPAGSEARRGDVLVPAGEVFTFPRVAMAATVGKERVVVFRKPRVAILSTGDEVLDIGQAPAPYQVRNSNAWSLAAQVRRAGGEPRILAVAPDEYEPTRALMEEGLDSDLLLLSGGVSAGKYDIVETVLADLGAEFYFTRVRIQPGQPVVFGKARGTFFFGLPGNPASTMVCFEIFAKAALELLGGRSEPEWPVSQAPLRREFRHKAGLTRFLPARLEGGAVTHVPWQGSSDVPALARANCFLIAAADRESWAAGEPIAILPL